jgi:predicted glycosyltransferase
MEQSSSHLDLLLYAHDGRGFGHASRSAAIGMALRRLFPHLTVLLVTGCRFTTELIAGAPLDWLKLPSYATRVVAGRSIGITGFSMFSDRQLADLRAAELAHLVKLYRPRLVLVDHTPQGKHRELIPALAAAGSVTRWVLGVRGVLGEVSQARSDLARQLFVDHYHGLLWYGDSGILGPGHCRQLAEQYSCRPLECGYVLRLAELAHWHGTPPSPRKPIAGVISVPWIGEKTLPFFRALAEAVARIPVTHGVWRVFFDDPHGEVAQLFGDTANCRLEATGAHYVEALLQAQCLVTYGGYNSLMDVLHARLPALVVLREMSDAEQEIHLASLTRATGKLFATVPEAEPSTDQLEAILLERLERGGRLAAPAIDTDGAAAAAGYLHNLIQASC